MLNESERYRVTTHGLQRQYLFKYRVFEFVFEIH